MPASPPAAVPSAGDPRGARFLLAAGALLGLLTVAGGALSAHLPARMLAPDGRALLHDVVEMTGWHVAAVLGCGLLLERRAGLLLRLAGAGFLLGLAGFAAGVLGLAFAVPGPRPALVRLAPLGGSLLMLSWLLLLAAVVRRFRS